MLSNATATFFLLIVGLFQISIAIKCYNDEDPIGSAHTVNNELVDCDKSTKFCIYVTTNYEPNTNWACAPTDVCTTVGYTNQTAGGLYEVYIYCCDTDGCNDQFTDPSQQPITLPPTTTPPPVPTGQTMKTPDTSTESKSAMRTFFSGAFVLGAAILFT